MNNSTRGAADRRERAHASGIAIGIDWEDMPSLAHLLAPTGASPSAGPAWAETMPCELDTSAPSDQFRERLPGLDIREVTEPDIFRHFFDRPAQDANVQRP